MNVLIILAVLFFAGGLFLLGGKSSNEKKTREEYLKELADFLEGTLELIDDGFHVNSYRINFKYSGEEFVYEDLEKQGFKDKVYMAYLKLNTFSNFSLTFKEKRHTTKIRTNIFIASEIPSQQSEGGVNVQAPKHLKDLDIFTKDTFLANKLFENVKISSIFKQFKNVDARGRPFMALKIVNGVVTLDFYPQKSINPNIPSLKVEIESIEDYLDKLLLIVDKIKG